MILSYIAGPLIGAAIGYCTNFVAVKMLFYPRREIRLWGHRLPFTPGAIPKGKPRLASAVGNIVGRQLLTEDDLAKQLLTEQTEERIVSMAACALEKDIRQEVLDITRIGEGSYSEIRAKVSDALCGKISDSLENARIGAVFAENGGAVVKEKIKGTMLEMFLTDDMVQAITAKGGEEVQKFIREEGKAYIQPIVDKELETVENSSVSELPAKIDVSKDMQRDLIRSVYNTVLCEKLKDIIGSVDISHIIEDKINRMDVDELEKLVLQVMKKELDTIVNLGALIGLVLGIINIFF